MAGRFWPNFWNIGNPWIKPFTTGWSSEIIGLLDIITARTIQLPGGVPSFASFCVSLWPNNSPIGLLISLATDAKSISILGSLQGTPGRVHPKVKPLGTHTQPPIPIPFNSISLNGRYNGNATGPREATRRSLLSCNTTSRTTAEGNNTPRHKDHRLERSPHRAALVDDHQIDEGRDRGRLVQG